MVNGPGPGGRAYYTTNVVGSKLFVFGGKSGGRIMHDMWTLDLNSRTFAYCFSEPFRPYIPTVKSQPVWELYEPTPGNEKPLPRWGHVSVTTGDHIIMSVPLHSLSVLVIISFRFGGTPIQYNPNYNDTWSFDISTRKWTALHCTGSIPSPRSRHAAVLVDDVMYVFGGYSGDTYLDDLYALQLSSE